MTGPDEPRAMLHYIPFAGARPTDPPHLPVTEHWNPRVDPFFRDAWLTYLVTNLGKWVHAVDRKWPNLALAKVAAYYGNVERFMALDDYDQVWASKVFTAVAYFGRFAKLNFPDEGRR